jgi:hypothetical protein
MEQEPQKVAAFVWECFERTRLEAQTNYLNVNKAISERLGLDGYIIGTFFSDYEEFFDEEFVGCFGTEFDAHGA